MTADPIARARELAPDRETARRYAETFLTAPEPMLPGACNLARSYLAAEAEVARLTAALQPFADVDDEGDEDFPDEMNVVVKFGRSTFYALRLGDLRKARAALSAAPVTPADGEG